MCSLERKTSPTQLRAIKELAFAQVIAKRTIISFEDRINSDECSDEVKCPMLKWLEHIAFENNETVKIFIVRLFNVLCERDTKKRGIVLYGTSDSGKSTFANLLTAFYA